MKFEVDTAGIATAAAGAILACVGFFGRVLFDHLRERRAQRKERHQRLVALRNLLRASKDAFLFQAELRDRLLAKLGQGAPGDEQVTYDHLLSTAYPTMTDEQRNDHLIIRTSTMHVLKPLNQRMRAWLHADTFFRTGDSERSGTQALAAALDKLEAHLLFWSSKYEAWIPGRPEHCLVYTGDGSAHGFPFPMDLDALVEAHVRALKNR